MFHEIAPMLSLITSCLHIKVPLENHLLYSKKCNVCSVDGSDTIGFEVQFHMHSYTIEHSTPSLRFCHQKFMNILQ